MNAEVRAGPLDRLAGTLMCEGAVLGLGGSYPLNFLSLFLSAPAFAVTFLLGVSIFKKRSEGRLLAAAGLWFVSLGWTTSVVNLLFSFSFYPGLAAWLWVIPSTVGLVGTGIALAGATLKIYDTPVWAPSRASPTDRDRLAPALICMGALLALLGTAALGLAQSFLFIGEIPFALVLLFGVLLGRRQAGRAYAAAAVWSAMLGGSVHFGFLLVGTLARSSYLLGVGFVGILGVILVLRGASSELRTAPSRTA